MVGTQQVVGNNDMQGIMTRVKILQNYMQKTTTHRLINLKHPIYFVISTLYMTKLTTLPRL
jgi:hypothetical protein